MPKCELCGSETEKLFLTNIEGASMKVCFNCSKMGNVIKEIVQESNESFDEQESSDYVETASSKTEEIIVSDFGRLIKNARESKGLKQKELAKKLAIKESLLHNIESGHFTPSLDLAKKISHFLHVKLVDTVESKGIKLKNNEDSGPLTFADILKKSMKK
jgi:putative transcription factor